MKSQVKMSYQYCSNKKINSNFKKIKFQILLPWISKFRYIWYNWVCHNGNNFKLSKRHQTEKKLNWWVIFFHVGVLIMAIPLGESDIVNSFLDYSYNIGDV